MKATVERKRFNNLYSKIDKIAKKGNLGLVEYKKLVNDIINDGPFYILTSVLERKYKINVDSYTTTELKESIVYDQIRFVTNSKYSEDLKNMYDKYSVYQMGKLLYKNEDGTLLGEFEEKSTPTKIDEIRNFQLTVYDNNGLSIYLDSLDTSLLFKYEAGVKFLLGID